MVIKKIIVLDLQILSPAFLFVTTFSGDFSHGHQHVFWTCLDLIVKSRDMSPKKYQFFEQVQKKMDGLLKTKIKFIK